MPAVQNRSDQHPRPLVAVIPAQRGRSCHDHDQVAADDRWVEELRAGRGQAADDPLIRALAQWRTRLVEGT